MYRSKLRNQILKLRTPESKMKYNKQRNLFLTLLRKAERKYYKDMKLHDVNGKKKFWKKIKPLFGNKVKENNVITSVEGNKLITDNT